MTCWFRPLAEAQVERIAQALRRRHRSRYQVSVRWRAPGGAERLRELTADPVSDTADDTPALLVMVRALGERTPRDRPPAQATPVEARILALPAEGATTARAARETGLTPDGVTYHLRRLSARWGAANRTELVARAYASGVLAAGVWPPGCGRRRRPSRRQSRRCPRRRGRSGPACAGPSSGPVRPTARCGDRLASEIHWRLLLAPA